MPDVLKPDQTPDLLSRRFVPLFGTQFLGAFNDNLFKTAMLFLITFHLPGVDIKSAATMVTAAAGVFILPFFLFSGIAGQLADARDKAAIARAVKLAEVVILGIGGIALMFGSVPLLFACLFGMGTHSTVFGPVKYAILPQHLRPEHLLTGTGLVEGGTFVAILLGQIAGGLLPTGWAAGAMLAAALAGVVASRFIPPAPPAAAAPAIDWNPVTASTAVIREAFAVRPVWLATLAISWFWALGAIFTTEFVPLVKGSLHASEAVATLFLAVFTVGIATGSAAVGRLLQGRVSAKAAPWAAVAMAAASLSLLLTVRDGGHGGDIVGFVTSPAAWPILLALFVLAFAGGVFSVPLYGILQTAGGAATRSGAVAANNIVNAAFQVGGTLLAGSAVAGGVPIVVVLAMCGASALVLIPLLRRL
ncbi:MFS transporter [Polymorphobacter sp. PAMC 29334]|uniref:MFS transporter n=1 Tax=Polymorphobacter sp. PAMC 29334 TaxID=2862331 RepID=UPI001C75989F|nr:MFS transporter [Polymorphobacter sp. PAMC 29334]QYE36043.1 MFS transporter [Polymorphobacter sp. PAMC 29334]